MPKLLKYDVVKMLESIRLTSTKPNQGVSMKQDGLLHIALPDNVIDFVDDELVMHLQRAVDMKKVILISHHRMGLPFKFIMR